MVSNKNSNSISADVLRNVHEQMISIPRGEIILRNHRKNEVRSTEVQPHCIASYPVTQALFEAITGTNPSIFKGENRPVESVSWFEAVAFCNRLSEAALLQPCYVLRADGAELNSNANGFRLPSEAEWEHACRAGSRAATYGDLAEIAWYEENSQASTHEVGQKKPNAWGLYDMLGNVWEWCTDLYDPEIYGSYRVFRGGGWADPPRGCLASNRRKSHPTYKIDDLGFRLARST